MKKSFSHFMTGLIDYAGLFPPTSLSLNDARQNYSSYLTGNYAWMLGQFILPASQLSTFQHLPGSSYSLILTSDIKEQHFQEQNNSSMILKKTRMVETCLPDELQTSAEITSYLQTFIDHLRDYHLQEVDLFVEAISIDTTLNTLLALNNLVPSVQFSGRLGFKLRCGGLSADAFPTPGEISAIIAMCRDHKTALKFTAGMHQPLGSHNYEYGVWQHGFINLFAAVFLAEKQQLNPNEIERCVRDSNPENFIFEDDFFSWQGNLITTADIKKLRLEKAISFGSCSFDEPVEGVRKLGLLTPQGAHI